MVIHVGEDLEIQNRHRGRSTVGDPSVLRTVRGWKTPPVAAGRSAVRAGVAYGVAPVGFKTPTRSSEAPRRK